MVEISTSILNVDKEKSIKTFYEIEAAHTDYFHIDVMDGKFVKNDNVDIMIKYSEYIKHISSIPLDVHLMVNDVQSIVEEFLSIEPRVITFHIEALNNKEEVLNIIKKIKNNNCKVGIAIKPNTEIEEIYEYLPYIHQVLIMTVEPGEGGQKLISETIEKIKILKRYLEKNEIEIDIEADGGINVENIKEIKNAGVNIAVAGSAIIKSDNYKETIKKLKET